MEAGLPLLSVPKKLRRMKMAADTAAEAAAFEAFANVHRATAWVEVLAAKGKRRATQIGIRKAGWRDSRYRRRSAEFFVSGSQLPDTCYRFMRS
jgi:hypothetical protein